MSDNQELPLPMEDFIKTMSENNSKTVQTSGAKTRPEAPPD